jgi:hypothetical protein
MFNAIDKLLDGRDNIEPTFFINSDVDFAVELQLSVVTSFIDPKLPDVQFLDISDVENSSPAPTKELKLKGKGSVKRHASKPDTGDLIEVLTKKWKEDKDERD